MAAAIVVAFARFVAAHRGIERQPRPVPRGIGRTEDRHDGRTDGGGNVQRAGIARDHQRRASAERDEVANLGRRRQPRGARRGRDDGLRERFLAGAPQDERRQAANVAQERGDLTEALRIPPLVRPRRAGIDQCDRYTCRRGGDLLHNHFWDHTTTYDVKDKRVAGGGTAPDIGRNYAGLQNAISLLVESRGVGIGCDSFARRVHTHYVVMASVLRSAAENAGEIRKLTRAAREEASRRGRAPAPG